MLSRVADTLGVQIRISEIDKISAYAVARTHHVSTNQDRGTSPSQQKLEA